MAGRRQIAEVFIPSESTSLKSFYWTRHHLILNLLDDVSGRVEIVTPGGSWRSRSLGAVPALSTVTAFGTDPLQDDELFVRTEGFLTPPSLARGSSTEEHLEVLKRGPDYFDSGDLDVHQYFAISEDGTHVPYFVVGAKDLTLDGSHPTLLTGYGGFEISLSDASG